MSLLAGSLTAARFLVLGPVPSENAMGRRASLRCTGRRRERLANPLGEVEVVEPGKGCGPAVLFAAFCIVLMLLAGFSQW